MSATALDMVASCTTACPGGQDVFIDNFSLKDNVTFTDRINNTDPVAPLNGNLNYPGSDQLGSAKNGAG